MTAPDPKPLTRRDVAEMIRAVRKDARLFAAAEVNALRPRLEAAHHMDTRHTHLDSWAEDVGHRLDPEDDE